MALTDTAARNAKPKDKLYKLYDEKGLFLQVTPNGGKWWRFKYRYLNKEKLLAIGTYPEVTLAEARQKRDDARKLLSQSPPVDPSEVKKAQKQSVYSNQANSFELIAREWAESYFIHKSESNKERTLRRLELYIFPWLGNKPIADITAPEVLEVVKRPQSQNKLETAHITLHAVGMAV
jgi:hypothetical protein